MLAGTLYFTHSLVDTTEYVILLAADAHTEGILGTGNKKGTIPYGSTHEWRICHLFLF